MTEKKQSPQPSRAREEISPGVWVEVSVEGAGRHADSVARRAVRAACAEYDARTRPAVIRAGIVGQSAPLQKLFKMLDRIRGSSATILITGENGTGKELVARAVHDESTRTKHKFVACNASAFNDNLLESEIFGHKRGSFTGAVSDKPGLFTVADKGTFFLDEVGDMSPALQVKLLRVLQEGIVSPVGSTDQKKVDVRVIAATNRDLTQMVREGRFREDLFYRLHVVNLHVPALRERTDDIPLLVQHFLNRLGERDGRVKTLAPEVLACFTKHPWPGNIRELQHEVERLWIMAGPDDVIDTRYLSPAMKTLLQASPALPDVGGATSAGRSSTEHHEEEGALAEAGDVPVLQGSPSVASFATMPLSEALLAIERHLVQHAIKQHVGDLDRAATALGLNRRALSKKLAALGLREVGAQDVLPGSTMKTSGDESADLLSGSAAKP